MFKANPRVNHCIPQTVLTYHLPTALSVITNISGHLMTQVHCAEAAGVRGLRTENGAMMNRHFFMYILSYLLGACCL
jgi:hypothetical protein